MKNEKLLKDYILCDRDTIIAFDCFDTIISRNISPEHVMKLWVKEFINYFDLNFTVEEITIFISSLNLQQINNISILAKILKNFLNIKEEYFERKLIQIMVNTECRVTYLNKDVIDLLYYFENLNKKIILISDYYLSKEQLNNILKHHAIDSYFKNIFVSCDYIANKFSGKLYDIVLQELNIKTDHIIMIGDDIYSDFRSSMKQGIKSFHIDRKQIYSFYKDYNEKYRDCKFILKNSIIHTDIIKNNDLQNVAFAFYAFIDCLYSQLLKKNIKKVFFLAREGKFLKHLFDMYRQEQRYPNEQYIISDYLLVSRRSLVLPSLKKLNEENFDVIFKQHGNDRSIYSFLWSLNFTHNEIKNIEKILSGIDFNITIKNLPKSHEFSLLMNLPIFQIIYDEKRKSQRKYLLNYFKRMNISNPICLVDIGWKGTMQNCIFQLYHKRREVIGFYFGVYNSSKYQYVKNKKNQKCGIMFAIDMDSDKTDILSTVYAGYRNSTLFYEMLTACEDGSALRYTQNDVVIDNIKKEKDYFKNNIKPIQDKILFLYHKILNDFKMKDILFNDYKNEFIKIQAKLLFELKRNSSIYEDFTSYVNKFIKPF